MAYPTTLDSFTPKVDDTNDVMAADVNGLQTAVSALQTKVGADSSTVESSHDYKIAQLESTRELSSNKENSTIDTSTTKYPTVNLLKTVKDTIPVKATGAEINTGTDDAKFVTAKAITDQTVLLKKSGGTMTGDIQLGETDIKLDAVLSGDEKWSGIVTAGTAGATLAVGDVCYLGSAGKWLLNDGILDGTDTGFDKQLGICVLASTDTNPTEMLLYGKVRSAAFPAFTVGSPVYLDDTAGDLTVTQPSTTNFAIRKVGYALTAEDLLFNPSNDYIVHI